MTYCKTSNKTDIRTIINNLKSYGCKRPISRLDGDLI